MIQRLLVVSCSWSFSWSFLDSLGGANPSLTLFVFGFLLLALVLLANRLGIACPYLLVDNALGHTVLADGKGRMLLQTPLIRMVQVSHVLLTPALGAEAKVGSVPVSGYGQALDDQERLRFTSIRLLCESHKRPLLMRLAN